MSRLIAESFSMNEGRSVTAASAVFPQRLADCYAKAREALLAERNTQGYWTGRLSASALSTATAVMALQMIQRARSTDCGLRIADCGLNAREPESDFRLPTSDFRLLIDRGLAWLADHQNGDGGWGDTTKSLSNISTTMLAHAAFHATGTAERYRANVDASQRYITRAGGVQAVLKRYGRDKTFSVPILTHCALAGLVDWRDVLPLPFELACLPARFYKMVRLPVVSYALPALIAIGQVRYHHRRPRNPLAWLLRKLAIRPSLRVLERIQPTSGGFLEAAPLTSFVTMSLAGMGLADHPVSRRGVRFLVDSVRADGSWPIDTNLATWVTTLSVNALGPDLPEQDRPAIRRWLLDQQYREVHPYTQADPGGWAWTDLPGGVPDADDTPGALLALLSLNDGMPSDEVPQTDQQALDDGVGWLLGLQNRDGGWPTFCRGWGALPFDRSAPDISAHVIRALLTWSKRTPEAVAKRRIRARSPGFRKSRGSGGTSRLKRRAERAIRHGFEYLDSTQRADGSWLPLWFGNQFHQAEENPTYGTARVLAAFRDAGRLNSPSARRGLEWLRDSQNEDGGWGGGGECGMQSAESGIALNSRLSSVEETALAVESLVSADPRGEATSRGLSWLLDAVEEDTFRETSPIGFYFAKLWYFEGLYPISFTVAALRRAVRADSDC